MQKGITENLSSYVFLTATASTLIGLWQGFILTGGARREAKVFCISTIFQSSPSPLSSTCTDTLAQHLDPNAYASSQEAKEDPAKHAFNCAQRAHANFLEHQPQFLVPLLISGLRYPLASSALGLAWCVARIIYAVGYMNAKKEKGDGRYAGIWFVVAEVGLIGMAGWTGWSMVMA